SAARHGGRQCRSADARGGRARAARRGVRTASPVARRCRGVPSAARTACRGWRDAQSISISPLGYRQGDEVTSSPEIRRKRLLFRSWHRGTRESDLILGRFADAHLAGFDEGPLDRYEALLDCADADIFDWVCDRIAPPAEHDHDVTRLLLSFSIANPH